MLAVWGTESFFTTITAILEMAGICWQSTLSLSGWKCGTEKSIELQRGNK